MPHRQKEARMVLDALSWWPALPWYWRAHYTTKWRLLAFVRRHILRPHAEKAMATQKIH